MKSMEIELHASRAPEVASISHRAYDGGLAQDSGARLAVVLENSGRRPRCTDARPGGGSIV